MFEPLRLAQIDPTRIPHSYNLRTRNLGAAVLLAAIRDYKSSDPLVHGTAANFLYPATREDQEHLDWAIAMADDLSPAWFRQQLDGSRRKWDAQRRVM